MNKREFSTKVSEKKKERYSVQKRLDRSRKKREHEWLQVCMCGI